MPGTQTRGTQMRGTQILPMNIIVYHFFVNNRLQYKFLSKPGKLLFP